MNATLLCVALLVPGYGEKDILQRIQAAGGRIGCGVHVTMPRTTTDADLGDLCELGGLEHLRLSQTWITDTGLRTVADLRGLTGLDLSMTAVTDVGLRHLESLRNLEILCLARCPHITDEGIARLQKALPKCEIYR
jgi:hypothetical protein